jgi:hypothetical protein
MHNTFSVATRVAAVCLIVGSVVFTVPTFAASRVTTLTSTAAVDVSRPVEVASRISSSVFDTASWSAAELGGVAPSVFALALEAASRAVARGDAAAPQTLTVLDCSKPSTDKRLWVYDLRTHALLFHDYVAHGRGSGENLATMFSNVPESNRSSLGLFRTGEAYIGKHGLSLRLDGLERGINDRARERAIVIHGADYVNATTARIQGRLGRSLGCPAVRPEIASSLIQAVKDGGLLFAYYPEQSWLEASTYLD